MIKISIFALTLLLLSNIPSLYYSLYIDYEWFDTAQHFLGGFFIAMLMAGYLKNHLIPQEYIKNILIIVGATIFIGVVWEFAEFIANQTLVEPTKKYLGINAYFMGDLADTIVDLLMDMLGAFAFFAIHSLRGRNTHQS